MGKAKAFWLFLGFGAGVLIGLAVLIFQDDARNNDTFIPKVGETIPDFTGRDLNSSPVSLNEFSGKPILINFWASWCQPCMEELPYLQEVSEKYAGDLIVIGINSDDSLADMQTVVTDLKLTFPIWHDPQGEISRSMLISALPTSYFIDQNGKILGYSIGIINDAVIEKYFPRGGK